MLQDFLVREADYSVSVSREEFGSCGVIRSLLGCIVVATVDFNDESMLQATEVEHEPA
ncbi:MAG: hypothetical protein U0470_05380 [Anaerolineae bacterium]